MELKLRTALQELKDSNLQCQQLLHARQDSEEAVINVNSKNSCLKRELVDLHQEFLNVVNEQDQLWVITDGFNNCGSVCVYVEALCKTTDLEDELIHAKENAKWFLNVSWQMEGVDIHLDVNVGKQLFALGDTLTMLTGYKEEDPLKMDYESDLDDEADNSKDSQESIILRRKYTDHLPAFVFDTSIDAKKRSKLIEKEMNEQAKIINDLRNLGASHTTIEYEMKRLHDLEAQVFKGY